MEEKILKLEEVKSITSLSTASIYRLMGTGIFPKQIKLSTRSSGWLESEIKEYLDKCIKNREVQNAE